MSILRNSAVAGLVAGAALAVPSAAFASTIHTAAPAAAPASTSVHQVPCTSNTFNVYHGHEETCYAGLGTKNLDYGGVYRITTGKNMGCIEREIGAPPTGHIWFTGFGRGQSISNSSVTEVLSFTLANELSACP